MMVNATNTTNNVFMLIGHSCSDSPVSAIVAIGNDKSYYSVNYHNFFSTKNLLKHSFYTSGIESSYGILFHKFCKIDDKNDKALLISEQFAACLFYGSIFDWSLRVEESTPQKIVFSFKALKTTRSQKDFRMGGYISIRFTIFASDDQFPPVPSLQILGGLGMLVEVVVTGFKMNPKQRLGLAALVFTNGTLDDHDQFRLYTSFNIADEVERGNFRAQRLQLDERTQPMGDSSDYYPAYMYWRSACYTKPLAGLNTARTVKTTLSFDETSEHPIHYSRSLAIAFYGERFNTHATSLPNEVGIRMLYVLFGTPGDGFYESTFYTSWNFVLSLGKPLMSSVHTFGFRILYTLLLPLIAAVVVACYLIYRWRCTPEVFEADYNDPLLNDSDGQTNDASSMPSSHYGTIG